MAGTTELPGTWNAVGAVCGAALQDDAWTARASRRPSASRDSKRIALHGTGLGGPSADKRPRRLRRLATLDRGVQEAPTGSGNEPPSDSSARERQTKGQLDSRLAEAHAGDVDILVGQAAADDLAALGGNRRNPYVRSLISRPGATDPLHSDASGPQQTLAYRTIRN